MINRISLSVFAIIAFGCGVGVVEMIHDYRYATMFGGYFRDIANLIGFGIDLRIIFTSVITGSLLVIMTMIIVAKGRKTIG